ncbi:MAG: hypothetical protein JRH19_17815 [Deltaproteobacteria bacterium]|nr:hypothetical protein [Deltaproteobacteria bacterium]
MVLLRLLAVAGLILSISSVAAAAPISVTYGFAGSPTGDASFGLNGSGGVGNVTGGTITIVYGSGSPLPNGTVGPISTATHASMSLAATGVTLLAQPVPGWQVGNLTVHTPILGFQGPFSIPTAPVAITGSAAVAVFNIAPGLIAFNGFGLMNLPGWAWVRIPGKSTTAGTATRSAPRSAVR